MVWLGCITGTLLGAAIEATTVGELALPRGAQDALDLGQAPRTVVDSRSPAPRTRSRPRRLPCSAKR
jgi:hypothetical protein